MHAPEKNTDPLMNLNLFIEIKLNKLQLASSMFKTSSSNVIKICLLIEIIINHFAHASKRNADPLVNLNLFIETKPNKSLLTS